MQLTSRLPKFFVSLLAILFVPQSFGVDFKIDLPSDAGRAKTYFDEQIGMEYPAPESNLNSNSEEVPENYRLDIPESTAVVPRNEKIQEKSLPNVELSDENEVETANIKVNQNKTRNNKANSNNSNDVAKVSEQRTPEILKDGHFPSPACLSDNIAFWERIYSETDVDEALLHDKEDLSRVFAAIKLPSNSRQRSLMIKEVRDHVERKLRELATNLDNPDSWDRTQRDLAKLYPGSKLNKATILRSTQNLRTQTGLKTRFEAGIQRSLTYLPTIHRIVKEHKLPNDIVFLPHVESSYHPRARSKVGAVGLWQIMPGTMRMVMGRKSVSQRTNVNIATEAASRILRQNYASTKSWPLALTAYNHGLHGVNRAIRNTGSRDICEIIAKYESRSFKFASSNFYAQFMAARNVAQARYTQIAKREGKKNSLGKVLASIGKGNL